ncbi:hypothetical protein ACFYP6_39625 [Streptomyces goshikiensis]|uniref:hypothetical protein n=1 Tax=Streptomyces goshikiensis TaxID=1942 RepID=UPI0036866D10
MAFARPFLRMERLALVTPARGARSASVMPRRPVGLPVHTVSEWALLPGSAGIQFLIGEFSKVVAGTKLVWLAQPPGTSATLLTKPGH